MRLKIILLLLCMICTNSFSEARAEILTNKKGITWKSTDKKTRLRIGGRLHYDFVKVNEDKTRINNEQALRRERIYLSGTFKPDWDLKIERDFSYRGKGFKNVWIRYSGFKNAEIKIGNQQVPFGMEASGSSSNHLKLIERSLVASLTSSYGIGGNYSHFWNDASLSAGLFKDGLREGSVRSNEGKWSAVGRVSYAPVHAKKETIHLGFSSEYRRLNKGKPSRISVRPEVGLITNRLVQTGNIASVDTTLTNGVEAAWAHDNILLQAEYINKRAERDSSDALNFHGGYIQGTWVLTGERHKYSLKRGNFKIKPKSKWGSLEAAVRYSFIDLNDNDITGGKQKNTSVGLNWYINENARIIVNYIWMDVDKFSVNQSERPQALLTRFQIAF